MECQTDAFLDQPPSPLFIAAKSGTDMATQILEGDVSELNKIFGSKNKLLGWIDILIYYISGRNPLI